MSARRREFARQFVLLGGNGTRAAVEAGYSDSDPSKAARRALLDPKVIGEIKRLATINIGAWLPTAIGVIIELMHNPETPPKVRLDAAVALLDRAGLSPPKGGVQVNVGVQVNGGEAQALIGSIWEARQKRMGSSDSTMSSIGSCMLDTNDSDEASLLDHDPTAFGTPIDAASDQTPGGVSSQRVPSPVPIHTSPSRPTIAIHPENADGGGQPEGEDDDRHIGQHDTPIDSSRVEVARPGIQSEVRVGRTSDEADSRNAASVWRSVAGAVDRAGGRIGTGDDHTADGRRGGDLGGASSIEGRGDVRRGEAGTVGNNRSDAGRIFDYD